MAERSRTSRKRYPFLAILAVSGAALLFAFDLVVGFIFMALVPPFIPVYICVLFSGACLLGNSLKYATRVSISEPAAMLRAGKYEEKVAERSFAARPSRARRQLAGPA
jgi:hypothetical protein